MTQCTKDPEQDTLAALWGEPYESVVQRIREKSPFGRYSTWSARPIIVKGNDDLR